METRICFGEWVPYFHQTSTGNSPSLNPTETAVLMPKKEERKKGKWELAEIAKY